MVSVSSNIRVRFAPSPTGHLHIGGVRSAIFNWLFARHNGGSFLLRVEDTDVARSSEAYVASQLASLRWMGLVPDEPIVYQLSRQAQHLAAAQKLMAEGKAYPCFCAPRAADDVVQDLEQGVGGKYAGTCRNKTFTEQELQLPHAVRFKVPDNITEVIFDDMVLGPVRVAAEQLDDYVIMRRDGTPIYNFCVVVDDIAMRITHIIRGQDHVSNTPKQVLLYRAMGSDEPKFAHIPLILGPSGAKLSKRDAAVSVEEYRAQGYLADALYNYLVRLGWSCGDREVFTHAELVQLFSLDQVGKKGGIFDTKKLQWLNGIYLREATPEHLLSSMDAMEPGLSIELEQLWPRETLHALIREYQQRALLLRDIADALKKLAPDPQHYDVTLIAKWRSEQTLPALRAFMQQAGDSAVFDHAALLACANGLCESMGLKLVALAQPLRLALTGGIMSPGVFELMALLGKQRSLKRIEALCHALV